MVVGVSKTPKKTPLLPSESDNGPRRPKSRGPTSTSSYSSSSNSGEMSNAAKLLLTSTTSLSVSFQGLPVSKAKPEKRNQTKDQMENSKPVDHQLRHNGSFTKSGKLERCGSLDRSMRKSILDSSANVPRPRGIMVPARFLQETNKPGSPVSNNNGLGKKVTQKLAGMKKQFCDYSISYRSRGMASPSRARNEAVSTLSNNRNNTPTPSILSFVGDARRGKDGESRFVDAHVLRLLYSQHLQWRLVNARANAAMRVRKVAAEKSLYNAWVTTSKLRHSVKSKRIELQMVRQELKVYSILKGQMLYLENWDLIESDHSSSLLGAVGALEASTLRLPVVGGAKTDIQDMKDSISSAADVMQATVSPICSMLTKVEHVSSLASELASLITNERASLDQCKDLLSTLTAMQVTDCSLRSHALQLKHAPSSLITDV